MSQSNYIPWKGYFDLIHDVDLFVFLDDVQYTKGDWRNRNRIKTPQGPQWLTIPVGTNIQRRICDVAIPNSAWQAEHWWKLQQSYARAPHFGTYREALEHLYRGVQWTTLSELNQFLVRTIARDFLGIETEIRESRELMPSGRKEDRLLDLLLKLGTDVYLSGPAAKSYLRPERFAAHGIDVVWHDYSGYPEYPQLHGPFVHEVTILDLLFHVGPAAPELIWGWRRGRRDAAAPDPDAGATAAPGVERP